MAHDADEIPEPDDLDVRCSVGGEPIAEDSTRFYNFKVAELLSYISQFQTLHPGDVLCCGTAFKASPGRRSIHQANLQVMGGPVEVGIEGLGTLTNPVVVERKPIGNWRLPAAESRKRIDGHEHRAAVCLTQPAAVLFRQGTGGVGAAAGGLQGACRRRRRIRPGTRHCLRFRSLQPVFS